MINFIVLCTSGHLSLFHFNGRMIAYILFCLSIHTLNDKHIGECIIVYNKYVVLISKIERPFPSPLQEKPIIFDS